MTERAGRKKAARPARLPERVGRLPLSLWVPVRVLDAVDGYVPRGERTAYIVAAVVEQLKRDGVEVEDTQDTQVKGDRD